MNFNETKPEEYSKETFGKCIRLRREELGYSLRKLAKAIGMSAVYLSDIERGIRSAPTGANSGIDYMENLISELKIPQEQVHAFYTMAESTYGRYADINSYLAKKPAARIALRLADEQNISDEEWEKFIKHIKEINK